jgi:hypothetical protein
MRRALCVCLAVCAAAQPARAQTRIYVSGDLFAEVTRFSRAVVAPDDLGLSDVTPRDGVTAGGGGRIGAFFSSAWSLELGVDLGKTISNARTLPVRVLTSFVVPGPAPQFESRTSSRFSATSVLVGYHPPARGRVQAGFRGGLTFMHVRSAYTTANVITVFPPITPTLVEFTPTISVTTSEYTSIGNGLTATLAAEAAIATSSHFAVVPEVRAHAGGIVPIVIRPGVAARWRW